MTEQPMVATWDQLWKRFDLALAALPDEIRDEAVDAIRPELAESEAPNTHERSVHGVYGPGAGVKYYAVHDGDLNALEVASLSLAAIASSILGAGITAPLVAVSIASLVGCWWRYRRRRVELTMEQALVLLRLRPVKSVGMTLDGLWAALEEGEQLIVARDELESILKDLEDVVLTNGDRSKLVDRDGDRWWVVDV